MRALIRSETHVLQGLAYTPVKSIAGNKLLTIDLSGVCQANGNKTFLLASPRVFFSQAQTTYAESSGQLAWSRAEVSLVAKKLGNCSIELGISSRPNAQNIATKFIGSGVIVPIDIAGAVTGYADLSTSSLVPARRVYPCIKIISNQTNVPLLQILGLTIKYYTPDLSCEPDREN